MPLNNTVLYFFFLVSTDPKINGIYNPGGPKLWELERSNSFSGLEPRDIHNALIMVGECFKGELLVFLAYVPS